MKTIIIVEDEFVNALLLQEMLKPYNVLIVTLTEGLKLLDVIEEKNADLILMDVKLPGINGYDLTRTVKAKYPNISIIIQTAFAFQSDMDKAKEAGCDSFIAKPIDKTKLIAEIRKYIKI